ncbi:MAG: LysR family transcriptional regulator [Xanthobacteraceae bacterium]
MDKFQEMRVFAAVVDAGSFVGASDALDMSKPAVSRYVAVARAEQIKDFRILPKALDPEEDGEPVTPTRKVKRHLMYERFKPLVESMYDDREENLIAGIAAQSA